MHGLVTDVTIAVQCESNNSKKQEIEDENWWEIFGLEHEATSKDEED